MNRISSRISNVCRRPVTCSENDLATSFHAPLKRASASMRVLRYCASLSSILCLSLSSILWLSLSSILCLSFSSILCLSLTSILCLSIHTSVGKRQKNAAKRGQRREPSENVSGRELRDIRQRDMRQRGLRQRESSIESVASRESSCERVA
jgi:hypothetical protein